MSKRISWNDTLELKYFDQNETFDIKDVMITTSFWENKVNSILSTTISEFENLEKLMRQQIKENEFLEIKDEKLSYHHNQTRKKCLQFLLIKERFLRKNWNEKNEKRWIKVKESLLEYGYE